MAVSLEGEEIGGKFVSGFCQLMIGDEQGKGRPYVFIEYSY